MNEHTWEIQDHGICYGNPPKPIWTIHHCATCGAKRTIIDGTPCFDPPGSYIDQLGELEPDCPR